MRLAKISFLTQEYTNFCWLALQICGCGTQFIRVHRLKQLELHGRNSQTKRGRSPYTHRTSKTACCTAEVTAQPLHIPRTTRISLGVFALAHRSRQLGGLARFERAPVLLVLAHLRVHRLRLALHCLHQPLQQLLVLST